MSQFVFSGRSRENRMNLVSDSAPGRRDILAEAQQRRQKREEEHRRLRAVRVLQRATRLLLARQQALRHAVRLLLHFSSALVAGGGVAGQTVTSAKSDATQLRGRLRRAVWAYNVMRRHEHLLPADLLPFVTEQSPSSCVESHGTVQDAIACGVTNALCRAVGSVIGDEERLRLLLPIDTPTWLFLGQLLLQQYSQLVQRDAEQAAATGTAGGQGASMLACDNEESELPTTLVSQITNEMQTVLHTLTALIRTAVHQEEKAICELADERKGVAEEESGNVRHSDEPLSMQLACMCMHFCHTHLPVTSPIHVAARRRLLPVIHTLFQLHGHDERHRAPIRTDAVTGDEAVTEEQHGCKSHDMSATTSYTLFMSSVMNEVVVAPRCTSVVYVPPWAEVCWELLCSPSVEVYLTPTTDTIALLLSVEAIDTVSTLSATNSAGRNDSDAHVTGASVANDSLICTLIAVTHHRLLGDGDIKGGHGAMLHNARGGAVAFALLNRLVRLLPFFLQQTISAALTRQTQPVLKMWLACIAQLCQRLCETSMFIDSILYDLHHTRRAREAVTANSNSSPAAPQSPLLTTHALGLCVTMASNARGRYCYPVSHLFSEEGGLQLLVQLSAQDAISVVNDAITATPAAAAAAETTIASIPGTPDARSALEIACSVYAWPLLSFALTNSQTYGVEITALFAKLVRTPRLLRLLWQLYRDRCAGLRGILPAGAALESLCVQAKRPEAIVRLPHWLDQSPAPTPASGVGCGLALRTELIGSRRGLFWEPHPALAVLFFTLFSYYVEVKDMVDDLQRGTVMTTAESWALILVLKEIVHRSHLNGVVPQSGSEAVAHVAYVLLAKLHTINETSRFVPFPALWTTVAEYNAVRALLMVSTSNDGNAATVLAEALTEVREEEQRHRDARAEGGGEESDDETTSSAHDGDEERRVAGSPAGRRGGGARSRTTHNSARAGDDVAFTGSVEWTPTARMARLLVHAPFLVSFAARARLLTDYLVLEQATRFAGGWYESNVQLHRNGCFEDAYQVFHGRPDTDAMYGVRFIDETGALEAGYGHGVYRECLVSVCNEGFLPEHGLFCQTEDGSLYPNPSSFEATGDPLHLDKISFLGAMVGRALRDGVLQSGPFALHFCNALLGRRNTLINLQRYDAQLYQHLLALTKLSEAEMGSMGLTFTYTVNSLGVTREVELIKGGAQVMVDARNCLHYIHLVAQYKLNIEGNAQTQAFRIGLESIVPPIWLQLFDSNELLSLFCGDLGGGIDLEDWRKHTVYDHDGDAESLPVRLFWAVVASLSGEQQSKLLQFVTSFRRPPLLGFRFLSPPFHVMLVATDPPDRLPYASTCFSLLKLPPYQDFATARAKIVAAIEGTNSFELT